MLDNFLDQLANQIHQNTLIKLDLKNVQYAWKGGDGHWITPFPLLSKNNRVFTIDSDGVIKQWDVNTETSQDFPSEEIAKDFTVKSIVKLAAGNFAIGYTKRGVQSPESGLGSNNLTYIISSNDAEILKTLNGSIGYSDQFLMVENKYRAYDNIHGKYKYRASNEVLSADGINSIGYTSYGSDYSCGFYGLCDNGNPVFLSTNVKRNRIGDIDSSTTSIKIGQNVINIGGGDSPHVEYLSSDKIYIESSYNNSSYWLYRAYLFDQDGKLLKSSEGTLASEGHISLDETDKPVGFAKLLPVDAREYYDLCSCIGQNALNSAHLIKLTLPDGRILGSNQNELILYDTLVHLRINYNHLSVLFNALEKNSSVTSCDLSNLPLGDAAVQAFTKMLIKNRSITTLVLQNNGITELGTKLLLAMLQINQRIVSVDLDNNSISDHFLVQIQAQTEKNSRHFLLNSNCHDSVSGQAESVDIHSGKFEVQNECRCVITQLVMDDPVMTLDGETYEREAIEEWLKNHDTSPRTNEKLDQKILIPSKAIKRTIVALHETYPKLLTSGEVYFPKSRSEACLTAVRIDGQKELKRLVDLDRRLLLDSFCDIDGESKTLLYFILCFGSIESLQVILTALSVAEFQQQIIATGDNGISLFKEAVRLQKTENAKSIAVALNWNLADYNEQLFAAISNHDQNMVSACLKIGATLDTVDHNGNTPLHAAVDHDDSMLLEFFANHGANIHMLNTANETVLKYTEKMGNARLSHEIRALKKAALVRPYQDKILRLKEQLAAFKQLSDKSAVTENLSVPDKQEDVSDSNAAFFHRSAQDTSGAKQPQEYTSEQLMLLLEHYVGKYNVQICQPICAFKKDFKGLFSESLDEQLLQTIVAGSQTQKKTPCENFILPIYFNTRIGKSNLHWVALYIHFDLDHLNKPRIGYFNPMSAGNVPIVIKNVIQTVFPEINVEKDLITSPVSSQDDNDNITGSWIVAILEHLVLSQSLALPDEYFDIVARRKNDAVIMRLLQERPDYKQEHFDLKKDYVANNMTI